MPHSFNPIDCSLPDSSFHGLLQKRILALLAMLFLVEGGGDLPTLGQNTSLTFPALAGEFFTHLPGGQLTHQAPPSMGFSRQEYWSGVPLLSPHNVENNNTKEVLVLLGRFKAPHQTSQSGDPAKDLGIPREPDFEG